MPESRMSMRSTRRGSPFEVVLAAAACLIFVSAAVADDAESVRLAYKFQANQSLHFEYTQKMTMDLKRNMFQESIRSQTIADKHIRVISVDAEGNSLVEPVIDRARLTSRKDNEPESSFDSADGEAKCPSEYRSVLATVGKAMVRIKFAPNGKVLQTVGVNGGEKSAEELRNDASLNFLIVFPDHAIKVGDTWKDDFEINVQLDRTLKQGIKIRREYRLKKLEGSLAEIELKTATITPIREPSIELQVTSRLLTGTIVFDHVAGQIVSREMKVDQQVINGLGTQSLVHTLMTQSEKVVTNPRLAKREKAGNE